MKTYKWVVYTVDGRKWVSVAYELDDDSYEAAVNSVMNEAIRSNFIIVGGWEIQVRHITAMRLIEESMV